jgi:hypothetical protein
MQGVKNFEASEPVVIIGFGQMGQVVFIFIILLLFISYFLKHCHVHFSCLGHSFV